jgi:hypothetical protein
MLMLLNLDIILNIQQYGRLRKIAINFSHIHEETTLNEDNLGINSFWICHAAWFNNMVYLNKYLYSQNPPWPLIDIFLKTSKTMYLFLLGSFACKNCVQYSVDRAGRPPGFYLAQSPNQIQVMFWGGVKGDGTKMPLIFIEGNLTGLRYRK